MLLQASLGWTMYVLSVKSLRSSLPAGWGLPLAWALSASAVVPLLVGVIWYLTLGARGNIWIKVRSSHSYQCTLVMNQPFQQLRGIVKPTSTWHRNHQMHNFGGAQTKVQSLAQS